MQPIKDDIVGRVVGQTDFLEDHAAFNIHVMRIEHRVHQNIADNVEPKRHVLFENARVIGRHFAAGVGVDIAAYVFDLFGNL